MKVIYKYHIAVADKQEIDLPDDYEILCVQVQKGNVCLWVKHASEKYAPRCNCKILMYGTGHLMSHGEGEYIGTVQLDDGNLVLHVFEG